MSLKTKLQEAEQKLNIISETQGFYSAQVNSNNRFEKSPTKYRRERFSHD